VLITEWPFSSRRTVYGFIDRQNLDSLYRTFDFAVPDTTSPRRFVTTVPQQALFLMNSPFLHEQSRRLAASIRRQAPTSSSGPVDDSTGAVRRLYRRVFGRPPEPHELALATEFVSRAAEASSTSPRLDGWKRLASGKLKEMAADPPLSPLEQLAQVLLLTNEFLFVD
jgi:hypothetical protein